MSPEEAIKNDLERKFDFLNGNITIKRARRIFVDVPFERFHDVLDYMIKKMRCAMLSGITGLDEVENLAAIYHMSPEGKIMVNLKVKISREKPHIKSIMQYFPIAEMYERELEDLLGIHVDGLPEGRRYPLPDGWPKGEHPLRKDYKGAGLEMKLEGADA